MTSPLAGLRVLDLGTRISAPFCAGLLGEMGAEVIKVELPGGGDFMREIGPFVETPDEDRDYSLFWAVEGRGRKGITLDLRTARGQELFRRLAARSDVVCENFRPGTLERWGIGPDRLDPRLVTVRISVFGQDGPNAHRPGLDRLGIGYGGLLHLTGYEDRPPVRPGVTVSDYLTGVFAAHAAVSALYQRDARGTGKGVVIDACLYGSVLRILEWTLAGYDKLGIVRERSGNRLPTSAPLDNYPTADAKYVCIVAGSDANFRRLCRAMQRPDLAEDPRFERLAARAEHSDVINDMVAAWTSKLPAAEIEKRCIAEDVPVATAYTAADIFTDAHMADRGDLVTVDDPVVGALRQQAPFPRFAGEQPPTPCGAPTLGQDNREVFAELLGLSDAEVGELLAEGVI
ncbi:MAG: Succinyl-CoA--L-malate CoA-transferase beta subunit [Acidimicrobiales bacterium]|nr:MAG: CoA transferase [Actinomycetota bacterium]MBV6507714.1 Succinyl-CoA--L-malate CoA-transferase beta subunit [Acidimicrobiales bacterium]RIK07638.1 MAG: formyl-CoA transferase [Acidobacteriota bacterium]